MRPLRYLLLIAGVSLLGACEDPLRVTNVNDPDRDRVLSQPADLEKFITDSWSAFHNGQFAANDAIRPQVLVAGLENFSDLANFGMNLRVAIPRNFIDNQRGNPVEGGNYRDFLRFSRSARSAAVGLAQLAKPGFSIGTPAADARATAFARFVLGVSLGSLALVYDSASIITPEDDPELVPPLS